MTRGQHTAPANERSHQDMLRVGTPYSILQRSLHTNTTLSDKHFVGWGPTFPMGPLGPGHWGPINGRPGHNQHVSALWRPGVLHTVKAVKQEAKTKVEATERVMCHVQGDRRPGKPRRGSGHMTLEEAFAAANGELQSIIQIHANKFNCSACNKLVSIGARD